MTTYRMPPGAGLPVRRGTGVAAAALMFVMIAAGVTLALRTTPALPPGLWLAGFVVALAVTGALPMRRTFTRHGQAWQTYELHLTPDSPSAEAWRAIPTSRSVGRTSCASKIATSDTCGIAFLVFNLRTIVVVRRSPHLDASMKRNIWLGVIPAIALIGRGILLMG